MTPVPARSLRPHLGQNHLGALGSRVNGRPVELSPLALQVVGRELLGVHAAGGHVNDPGRGAALEHSGQQLGEQERTDHVGGQRELDPVSRQLPLLGEDAGVVDEDVETWRLGGKALGELAHRLQAAEVAQFDVDVASLRCSRIFARARSPRARLRTASQTEAPSLAKPSAAASPMPEDAPVINTTLPSIRGRGLQPRRRIR